MERNGSNVVSIIDFCGKRKPDSDESSYLKGLLLNSVENTTSDVGTIVILILLSVFPWIGIVKILRAVYGMYDITCLQLSDIWLECLMCCAFGVLGVFSIKCLINSIQKKQKDTYIQDVRDHRFLIIDVEVVEFEHRNYLENKGDYVSIKIKDACGNVGDRDVITVDWNEIKNTKKGLIVILQRKDGEEYVLYRLIPRYDQNSSFCQKYKMMDARK